MYQELLNNTSNIPLIEYRGEVLTRSDFSDLVKDYSKYLLNDSNDTNYYLLDTQNPLEFFPLLFALWQANKKIVFPTRDHFAGNSLFLNYSHTVNIESGKPKIVKHENYRPVDSLSGDEGDTVVFSSGSTGVPKGIVHFKENFFKNALVTADFISFSDYQSVTLLKPYLVSALSHFLVHYISNATLVFSELDDMEALGAVFERYPECAVVGSPVQIMMSLSKIGENRRPKYFFSSGDFMASTSIAKILHKYPSSVFFKVYGLAELGGRFFINRIDKNTSGEVMDRIGHCLKEIRYEVRDRELFVFSGLLYSGYIKESRFLKREDPFPTGDLVDDSNNHLSLFGRKDDEIKVGGNKVSLKNIENKIINILESKVAVVPEKHRTIGNLICLVIENNSDEKYERKEIMTKLRQNLESHEIPHKYYQINRFPLTQTMKIDRKKISGMLPDLQVIQ